MHFKFYSPSLKGKRSEGNKIKNFRMEINLKSMHFGKTPISIIISGTIEPRHSLDYGNSTGTLILTITEPSWGIIDTKYT